MDSGEKGGVPRPHQTGTPPVVWCPSRPIQSPSAAGSTVLEVQVGRIAIYDRLTAAGAWIRWVR